MAASYLQRQVKTRRWLFISCRIHIKEEFLHEACHESWSILLLACPFQSEWVSSGVGEVIAPSQANGRLRVQNMQDNEGKKSQKTLCESSSPLAQESSSSNLNHPSFYPPDTDPLFPYTIVFFLLQSLYRELFFFTFWWRGSFLHSLLPG